MSTYLFGSLYYRCVVFVRHWIYQKTQALHWNQAYRLSVVSSDILWSNISTIRYKYIFAFICVVQLLQRRLRLWCVLDSLHVKLDSTPFHLFSAYCQRFYIHMHWANAHHHTNSHTHTYSHTHAYIRSPVEQATMNLFGLIRSPFFFSLLTKLKKSKSIALFSSHTQFVDDEFPKIILFEFIGRSGIFPIANFFPLQSDTNVAQCINLHELLFNHIYHQKIWQTSISPNTYNEYGLDAN